MKILTIATACLLDKEGRLLTVRKRGTQYFMLPGGKTEPGERPLETVVRELAEEIGLTLGESDLHPLGQFEAPAANEPDHWVKADVFVGQVNRGSGILAQAEIDTLLWIAPHAPQDALLAPLLRERILPALSQWLGGATG